MRRCWQHVSSTRATAAPVQLRHVPPLVLQGLELRPPCL